MWIARDKDGYLSLFNNKPFRTDLTDSGKAEDAWVSPDEHDGYMICDKWFPELKWDDEPQEAYIFTEKDLEELRNSCSAVSLMNYLDDNKRADKKMCLSNGECEQIDKAFAANDWTTIIKYIRKYIDIESL